MKNFDLDYSLIDQIERHKKEQEQESWEALKETYKRAGELEAKIMVGLVGTIVMIATFILETPH